MTPEARVKWLLTFLEKEPAKMFPGEREALGYELRALVSGHNLFRFGRELISHGIYNLHGISNRHRKKDEEQNKWMTLQPGPEPMPDKLLMEIHAEVKLSANLLLSEDRPWPLPQAKTTELVRADSRKKSPRFLLRRLYDDEKSQTLDAIAEVLMSAEDRLRLCEECNIPFIPTRRQAYCHPRCSQRARDRNRPPRRKR